MKLLYALGFHGDILRTCGLRAPWALPTLTLYNTFLTQRVSRISEQSIGRVRVQGGEARHSRP